MSAVTMSAAQNSNKLGGGSNQDILDGEFLGLNHSPPQFTPSSYETSHFHKRIRSGSISGRLRSASELEEKGLIDRVQKGALKNLIMSGDEELLSALDKFTVEGDSSDLHALLKSGALEGTPGLDLDLLMDDLDLNFLQLTSAGGVGGGGGGGGGMGGIAIPGTTAGGGSGVVGGVGGMGGIGVIHEDNYQFDMDDMASFIAGDAGATSASAAAVAAASFAEDDLLAGLDRVAGLLGRSMSPSHSHVAGSFGLSPFGEDGVGGGLPAFLVSVKEEEGVSTSTGNGSHSKGGMHMMNARGSGSGSGKGGRGQQQQQHYSNIKNEPPSSSSKSIDIPKGKSPGGGGNKKAAVAATVGAAMAGNNNNKSTAAGAKGGIPPSGKASHNQQGAPSAASSTAAAGGASGAASALMPVPSPTKSPSPTPTTTTTTTTTSTTTTTTSPSTHTQTQQLHPSGISSGEKDSDKHYIGAYSPDSRRKRLEKFWEKKKNRIWDRKVKYDVRKNFADSRIRVKGRFVKKEDEAILLEVNTLTTSVGGGGGGGGGEGIDLGVGGLLDSPLTPATTEAETECELVEGLEEDLLAPLKDP